MESEPIVIIISRISSAEVPFQRILNRLEVQTHGGAGWASRIHRKTNVFWFFGSRYTGKPFLRSSKNLLDFRRQKEKREVSGSHPWMLHTSWRHPSGPSFRAPFSWTLALFLPESPKHLNCLKSGARSLCFTSLEFFFLKTDELRGFNTSTESTARRCKKGAAKNREPHANVLKTGRAQIASTGQQSTSARKDPKRNGSLAWTSEFNAPRTVMLRTMSFVMTPPAVSAPMSKRVRSRSSRPSNRVSASPGERATKPTWEVRARGAEQPAENSTESARKPNGELHQEPRQSRRAVPETPKATGENARAGKMTRPTKACTEPEQAHQREHIGQEVDKPAMGAD